MWREECDLLDEEKARKLVTCQAAFHFREEAAES